MQNEPACARVVTTVRSRRERTVDQDEEVGRFMMEGHKREDLLMQDDGEGLGPN